jgi:hypothetical protein
VFFYLGNRKSTSFVKWHCTQALVSQLGLFFFNSAGFWWTVSVLFYDETATNYYNIIKGGLQSELPKTAKHNRYTNK